jgi:hypothetical protein
MRQVGRRCGWHLCCEIKAGAETSEARPGAARAEREPSAAVSMLSDGPRLDRLSRSPGTSGTRLENLSPIGRKLRRYGGPVQADWPTRRGREYSKPGTTRKRLGTRPRYACQPNATHARSALYAQRMLAARWGRSGLAATTTTAISKPPPSERKSKSMATSPASRSLGCSLH